MIEHAVFEQLKKQYGYAAGWAIWQPPGDTPKSNTGDMSVFESDDLLSKLNSSCVFVGLNASETENGNTVPWSSFHSTNPHQNDYKLRYALMGTCYWGAYITDLIKGYPKTDSTEVVKDMKRQPQALERQLAQFKQEISLIADKPILIAMGTATYQFLKTLKEDGYHVVKIPHYAYRISKENYREKVLQALSAVD